MSLRRIFIDSTDTKTASVVGERAHHLIRVARLKVDEKVEVTDQKKLYVARGSSTTDERITFTIEEEILILLDLINPETRDSKKLSTICEEIFLEKPNF